MSASRYNNCYLQQVRILLIILLSNLLFTAVFAQVNDSQLASFYFQQGDYDKAVLYYQKLYEKQALHTYYKFYLKSLYALENLDEAKSLIKKQQKTYPSEKAYDLDLAEYFVKVKDEKKAEKILNKIVNELSPRFASIQNTADLFVKRAKPAYALRVYQKGRKILPAYPFNMEIAKLQGELGNTSEMVAEYLDLLEINPAYLQSVQNALNQSLGFEKGSKENLSLKAELYKGIQRYPSKEFYNELLIWILTQEKDFEGVYRQSISLDKRKNENGYRLLDLSVLAKNNQDFDLATKSLDYVIQKGKDEALYIDAKVLLLQVLYAKVKSSATYAEADLERLETEYVGTLDELGRNPRTVNVIKELAEIQGVYQKQYVEANKNLNAALKIPGISAQSIAELKLLMADLKLLQSDPWEASLLYMQVEKSFKYDRLGEIAKFRNARIYYFEGEFDLAKTMLDVLKGSTSKKISNDAMELSLLITDNSTIDTTTKPLEIFAKSDLYFLKSQFDESISLLDSLEEKYPGHALSDEILFLRSKIAAQKSDFEAQEKYLEEIVSSFPDDILADNALYGLAVLNDKQKNDPKKAAEYYKRLLLKYKDSLFVVEARKRFRELRGDELN